MIPSELNLQHAEISDLLECGTKVMSNIGEGKITSIYYYKGEYKKVVFDTHNNQIIAITKAKNPYVKNIFFGMLPPSQMVA